ncbi:MAG: hypothetical protein QOC86_3005, partial [Gaiellales bacterium]|nr:hypothetical protein [Gaiellales bacterium]
LALAYGFDVGKLVRYLAPAANPIAGVAPVDFRRCRSASCAQPRDDRLTMSGRLITEFTVVEDLRRGGGPVRVTYWMYRPGQRWQRIVREGGAGEIEAASSLRLRVTDTPALTPLEMVLARDQYDFPALEEPPWRGRVAGIYPG